MTDGDRTPKLPTRREEALPVPADNPSTDGVVSSAASGFLSDMRARALSKRAAQTHAHAGLLDARSRLAESAETLQRRIGRLHDLPNIIAEDHEVREDERIQAAHKREIAALRRQQELERERAALERGRMERDLDYHLTQATKQSEVEEQQAKRVRAVFYRKLQRCSCPFARSA